MNHNEQGHYEKLVIRGKRTKDLEAFIQSYQDIKGNRLDLMVHPQVKVQHQSLSLSEHVVEVTGERNAVQRFLEAFRKTFLSVGG